MSADKLQDLMYIISAVGILLCAVRGILNTQSIKELREELDKKMDCEE